MRTSPFIDALCPILSALCPIISKSEIPNPQSEIRARLLSASCKQGLNFTHDLFIFVKAQSNGFPWADTGANTASVADGLIDFNDAFICVKSRHLEGA